MVADIAVYVQVSDYRTCRCIECGFIFGNNKKLIVVLVLGAVDWVMK